MSLWTNAHDLAHQRELEARDREIEELRREIGGLRHQLETVTAERDLALEDFQLERLRNTRST